MSSPQEGYQEGHTDYRTAQHETPFGTRIICQTSPDGNTREMSLYLSQLSDLEVTAAPSTWTFTGPGHKQAANFVVDIVECVIRKSPETFAAYNAFGLRADQSGEPISVIAIAALASLDSEAISQTARELALQTNELLEGGQSDIRLPLTD